MKYPRARGRTVRHEAGRMNKSEAEYRLMLGARPDVFSVDYERITFKLADDTRYTPDFHVLTRSGEIEIHEVKGFMEDDAWVKLKVAAEQFQMYRFFKATRRAKKHGGGWEVKEVPTPT